MAKLDGRHAGVTLRAYIFPGEQQVRGIALACSGATMEPHSIVVVSLHTPKEKLWGELLSIHPAGITIRGVDLNSFDHFVNQINGPDQERTGLPTLFFPMNRVERIALDESSGSIPSLSEVFARKVGRPITEYLSQFA
ncbi:MAG TPA: hypothetical protein VIW23_19055 [Candidatus Acidoferrum sp.]